MSEASEAVDAAARSSYGRLVAWLTSRCGDIALAEDAVSEALEAALRVWPDAGVPARPESWLLTTARRRVIDRVRRDQSRARAADQLRREAEEAAARPFSAGLPDRRLELLFLCAHPEIDAAIRTPLILQSILGLNAKRIGSAFLVPPATMGQRLVRAKRRIVTLGLKMELPSQAELEQRLPHVLEAIYAAYASGWDGGTDEQATGLSREALWLARLLAQGFPRQAEALGLLALIAYAESRRDARRDEQEAYVPLEGQDVTRWDHALILEGEQALWNASKLGQPARYQLEAAIQSVHAHRARSGETNWVGINVLYRQLVTSHPTAGAIIGWAASFARLGDAERALDLLDEVAASQELSGHQPWWAVRAHVLRQLGRTDEAAQARTRAIGLTEDPAVRAWLLANG